MAKFNIKKIIDANTVDEVVDYDKVNEELELQNKNVVAKEVAKIDKDSIINSFLLENEFDSVDAFNAFKKNGATADTEELKRIKGELKIANDTLKLKTDAELALTKELSPYKNQALLRKAELNGEKDIEYIEFQINKLEGETFEDKLNTYKATHPDVFTSPPPKKNIITTGTKTGTVVKGEKLGWEKELEKKYGEL
jgi:hypothetical protein